MHRGLGASFDDPIPIGGLGGSFDDPIPIDSDDDEGVHCEPAPLPQGGACNDIQVKTCPTCSLLNEATNTRCSACEAKLPQRVIFVHIVTTNGRVCLLAERKKK